MISREPEILIVDDVEVAANDFAALIKANLRFNVIAVSTSVEAIEVVKKHNIRVVVLDQVMPGKKGTDLYKEIKNINPSIKAIMLTGEASSDEVGLAMRLGFSNYLNKGEILKLPEIVGGGGGGRPNMAQAGGKNPAGIDAAIAEAAKVLAGQIDK